MRSLVIPHFLVIMSMAHGQSLSDSLLLHYPLNGNAVDVSGHGRHGVMSGPTSAPDRYGNQGWACYFDGINDFIEFPNLAELKPQLPVSFSFWVKYQGVTAAERNVFNTSFEEDVSAGVFFTSQQSTGKFAVNYGDGQTNYTSGTRRTYVSNNVIDTSQWQHVVAIVNGPLDMEIYLNCHPEGGLYSGSGGQLFYSALPGTIGKHDANLGPNNYFFKGYIDEFRYWNREITLSEMFLLCNELPTGTSLEDGPSLGISIYPVPANEAVTLSGNTEQIRGVEILNMLGELVMAGPVEESRVDIRALPPGPFLLRVLDKNNEVLTVRMIVVE